MLAQNLRAKGHEVDWWASTFVHSKKINLYQKDTDTLLEDGSRLRLIYAPAYQKHISIKRILHHRFLALRLADRLEKESAPDIIHCSYPTMEVADIVTRFGQRFHIPVILDIRDFWPDTFVEASRWWLKPAAWLYQQMMLPFAKKVLARAYALSGTAPGMVEWGAQKVRRSIGRYDRSFPLGYQDSMKDEGKLVEAARYWDEKGVVRNAKLLRICFFGTIGVRNLEWLLEMGKGLEILESQGLPIQFVICGDGEGLEILVKKFGRLKNTLFAGWVNSPQIWGLMQRSQMGILPYKQTKDFKASIPNKGIEYLAGSLPILTSLEGYFLELLQERECGIRFENGFVMAQKLKEIYRDQDRLQQMGQNARRLFEEKFRAEKIYSELVQYLEEIVQDRREENGEDSQFPAHATSI